MRQHHSHIQQNGNALSNPLCKRHTIFSEQAAIGKRVIYAVQEAFTDCPCKLFVTYLTAKPIIEQFS